VISTRKPVISTRAKPVTGHTRAKPVTGSKSTDS
jgi:hypothetical protein